VPNLEDDFNKFINDHHFTLEIRRRYAMPICEICGMEVIKVSECSQCESRFCDECGDLKRKLCYDCIGWDDEADDESDDIDDWDDGWDDNDPN